MNPEEMKAVREGVELSNYLPYLEDDLNKMKKAVVNSVLTAINTNTFSPETAFSKWYEYAAIERLGQKARQKVQVGISLGEKLGG